LGILTHVFTGQMSFLLPSYHFCALSDTVGHAHCK